MKKHNSEVVEAVMGLISDAPKSIAEKTGINKSTIYRIQNQKFDPPMGTIEKIMKSYNITWLRVLWKLTSPKGATLEKESN